MLAGQLQTVFVSVNGFSSRPYEIVCSRKKGPLKAGTQQDCGAQRVQSSGSTQQHGLLRV